jgi:hypothetical protein
MMADDLCQLLIHSYQLVLQQVTTADLGKAANDPRVPVWQTVAHRILYYSHRIQRNQQVLCFDERNALWLRIYRIYLVTLRLPGQERVIGFAGVPEYPTTTLANLVRRILLVALIPLHTLRNAQIRELFTSIDFWARQLTLPFCSKDADHKRNPFHVDPKLDVGPLPADAGCHNCPTLKCILIDTAPLQDRITNLMMRAARSGEDRATLEDGTPLSVSTLEVLRNSWKERPKRIAQRDDTEESVSVVFTIPAIHHTLQEHHKIRNTPPKPKAKPRFEAAAIREMTPQALESMFTNDAADTPPSLDGLGMVGNDKKEEEEETAKPAVIKHQAIIRDHSQSGYRIEITSPQNLRIRVGDMAAIFRSPEDEPVLGVVRWIHEAKDKSVLFGMLLIAHPPIYFAGFSNAGAKAKESTIPCLVAEHVRDDKTILLMDHYPDIRDKRITLFFRDEHIPIAFNGWPVEESRSFEGYEFGIRRGDSSTPDPSLPMLTCQSLEELTKKDTPKQAGADAAKDTGTNKKPQAADFSLDEAGWQLD